MALLLNQWVFWSLLIGALLAVGYLVLYDRKNAKVHKRKTARRDALLIKVLHQAERFGNDVTTRADCSGSRSS